MATLTGRSRRAEQRLQSLLLDRLSMQFQRRIAREIARAMHQCAADPTNSVHLALVEGEHERRLFRLVSNLHMLSARGMLSHLLGVEKADMAAPALANRIMELFAAEYGSELITGIISRSTINGIKQIVGNGIVEGLSEQEVARAIRSIAPSKSASRAQTIARTETHAAANWTAHETALATGIEMQREWVSAQNERTRASHAEADGQRRGMDEPFEVGDALLMYPGEYQGMYPHETINCRCAVVYIVD